MSFHLLLLALVRKKQMNFFFLIPLLQALSGIPVPYFDADSSLR